MPFRPVLGAAVRSIHEVRLPTLASYKLDGIRAFWLHREFFSRTLKTIPNRDLQVRFYQLAVRERINIHGWDGELIFGEPNAPDVFRRTESAVMSRAGSAEGIRWFVFDNFESRGGFAERLESLCDLHPLIYKLDQEYISTHDELAAFEDRAIRLGYEGVVCRTPMGKYKQGRSTIREQILIKLKRFKDAEAKVIALEELFHNANEAQLDERGYTKRSSHQDGKVRGNTLGSLVVDWGGSELRIGTGFTRQDRESIWRNPDKYIGRTCTFRYLDVGIKDLPRHPSFKGWREPGF